MTDEAFHERLCEDFFMFIFILGVAILAQHFCDRFSNGVIPEAAASILIGVLSSSIIKLVGVKAFTFHFSNELFFCAMLPPIIYNSGYHCIRIFIIKNLLPIISLAIFGTIITVCLFAAGFYYLGQLGLITSISGAEAVTFGALISSIDPVATLSVFAKAKIDPNLYYLIFGESMFNDAVCITVFRLAKKMIGVDIDLTEAILDCLSRFIIICISSSLIGYLFAILTALMLKHLNINEEHRLVIISIFIISVYIPFFLAEWLGQSGIICILFTGIASRRYVSRNIGTFR